MKIAEIKKLLPELQVIRFKLPDGSYVPSHFHVTEVGLVTKHFIDCGGTERKETVANFQLWEAEDYDHRLSPQKFLRILNLCQKILGDDELDIEVEYQQGTISKFGLDFDGQDFLLKAKRTACLAEEICGIPDKKPKQASAACCSPGGGCC